MSYIQEADRDEGMLLPERLEDYVDKKHPVRILKAFVEGLDLEKAGFERHKPAKTGRPGYHPGCLIRLYVWGYLNKMRTSRELELACRRNLEVMWLMGKLAPDFKTIADFRKNNGEALGVVFREFNVVCSELGLFGRKVVAIDGTKLKAVNSRAKNLDKEALKKLLQRMDDELQMYFAALDRGDKEEEQSAAGFEAVEQTIEKLKKKQQQYRTAMEELEQSGKTSVSLTDKDSVRMKKVGVGYNAQIAVDDKHKLIAAQSVETESDFNLLSKMAQKAQEALDEKQLQVLADGGYYDQQEIEKCEQLGVEPFIPKPQKGASSGRFQNSRFLYDAQSDTYRCPANVQLSFTGNGRKRGELHRIYANPKACAQCLIKDRCTTGKLRRILRWRRHDLLEQMEKRMLQNPGMIKRRKALVEHPFANMMFWMGGRNLLTRGISNVRTEFCLSSLAYNFKRVLQIVDFQKLLEHIRKWAKSSAFLRQSTLLISWIASSLTLWSSLMFFNPRSSSLCHAD